MEWIDKGQEWLITNGANFLVNIIVFIIILFAGWLVIRALMRVTKVMFSKSNRVSETLSRFILNVLNKLLWLVLLMLALPRLGVDIAPLIAGLGVTGFIVGFAFQETLGNLSAGLMIMLNEPFKIGDYVDAGGHQGVVKEINMMATTMTTPDNKKIVIPNGKIWGGSVTNYTALDTRRVDLTVGVSYSADIGKTRDAIKGVLDHNKMVLDDPAPMIELVEMADSSVNLVVRPWCKTEHYWDVFFAVNRAIKEELDRNGIEIPFPQVDVHHHGLPERAVV
ncbi:MAG: mechanosensitive ion channel family protein [Candidatus Alcyoniella australis]|nr:mechanosensitive ion channel family protein [Candidatus Alcyoniella australis]